ncbi:MAG: N-6 DNA methylase [Candidatus Cloacimonetes bacterium]|nr:N-6 DNA methylase [Candidatus Cloacimonadota bacterium]MBT6994355.1 N-6 DNA methylase [Candidatus Cloacimonadota bacterium]
MSLFQKVIVKKYLKNLPLDLIEENYQKYTKYFNDFSRTQRIRTLKEEQYQEGFLRELFVECLNYTINPDENFNLTTEFKNKTDAEKADGAILKDNKPIAVIELKSTKTKDLKTIEKQAFNYKAHQVDCKYVITSNFEKIRLYINDATEFEEFNVFQLSKDEFKFLYLCFSKESLFENIPARIKEKSNQHEEQISKKLYNDYSDFRNKIFQNLTKNNPQFDKLMLFKKSQKLLDRFLFIFFAEDKGLIPANMISKIIDDYNKLKGMDNYTPLYSEFKRFFSYINKGNERYNISKYNGGLFKFDEILDNVKIDDDVLITDSLKLSNYDFDSEVDVNILGHIFEHSLDDIENITVKLSINETATSVTMGHVPLSKAEVPLSTVNVPLSKKTSRRKKEGVFYTPNYITKYIVENTIGSLCEEKKKELKLINLEVDDTYTKKGRKGEIVPSQKGEQLLAKLEEYKEWLLSLKILDPACGSGAFLNQALNFLIEEHSFIINLEADLRKGQFSIFDIDIAVLENNLYGVDINEESVEIAKLSLWLKTAKKGRKLTDLSEHIKCGNSLIDDPEIAGDKAFDWHKEFPQIFTVKDKKAWHITTALHNSRYSQRMLDYNVITDDVVLLTEEDEIFITSAIATIIKEDNLNIPAYNICTDHLHFIIVCEEENLTKIVGKIKAVSARKYNIEKGITVPLVNAEPTRRQIDAEPTKGHVDAELTRGHVPLSKEEKKKYNSLWTQKFGRKEILTDEQLNNTINYIYDNRKKHNFPNNKQLQKIINKITCTVGHAFRFEYNGGFDVVIGNPPYVFARENIKENEKKHYSKIYNSAIYQINTYLLFMEKSIKLLKHKGSFGLIVPNAWLMVYSGKGIREYLLNNCNLNQIINLEGYSFENVNVETIVILAQKEKDSKKKFDVFLSKDKEFVFSHKSHQLDFSKNEGYEFKVFSDDISLLLTKKIIKNSVMLDSIVQIKAGLQAYEKGKGNPKQTAEDVRNRPYDFNFKFDESTFKYLDGKNVNRYFVHWSGLYLKYGEHLAAPRTFNLFNGKKIIIREITGKYPKSVIATFNEDIYLYNRSNIAIIEREEKKISLKYILVILNSSLISYYFMKNTAKSVRKMFPKIILKDLRLFPFKEISIESQKPFIEKADIMLSLNKQKQEKVNKFLQRLETNFVIEKFTNKIKAFYNYDFKTLIAELKKKKIKLTLVQQDEWEEYFNIYQETINQLQKQITQTDKEIDQMVYNLYGLTKEEIEIVEKN